VCGSVQSLVRAVTLVHRVAIVRTRRDAQNRRMALPPRHAHCRPPAALHRSFVALLLCTLGWRRTLAYEAQDAARSPTARRRERCHDYAAVAEWELSPV